MDHYELVKAEPEWQWAMGVYLNPPGEFATERLLNRLAVVPVMQEIEERYYAEVAA